MKKREFAFASTTYDFEVYETAIFPTIAAAAEHAAKLADELQTDIEVWENRITVMPYARYLDGEMDDSRAIAARNAAISNEIAESREV